MEKGFLLFIDNLCSITGEGYPVAMTTDFSLAQAWADQSDSFQRRHWEELPLIQSESDLRNLG